MSCENYDIACIYLDNLSFELNCLNLHFLQSKAADRAEENRETRGREGEAEGGGGRKTTARKRWHQV